MNTRCFFLRFKSQTHASSSPAAPAPLVPPAARYLDPALKSTARTSPDPTASSGTRPRVSKSGFISAHPPVFVPTHSAPFVGDHRTHSASPSSSPIARDARSDADALSGAYTHTVDEDTADEPPPRAPSLPQLARSMTCDDIAPRSPAHVFIHPTTGWADGTATDLTGE
jgi:hypothetical protein